MNKPREELVREIEELAKGYLKMKPGELQQLLIRKWAEVKIKGQIPVRGDAGQFWQEVKERLVAKIVKNQVAASATLGYIVSQVVNWVIAKGWDISDLKIPIAILVAIVAQAVWEVLGSQVEQD